MPFIMQGNSGTAVEVDANRRAQRIVIEPNVGSDVTGHYALGEPTGIIPTIAAGAEVFQFRNSTTTLAIIERVVVQMVNAAAVTAAQEFGWEIFKATSWSAQGTLGNALDARPKRKQSLNNSAMANGDIRVSTTAALGGGTKTLDTYRSGSGPGPSSNAIGAAGPAMPVPEDDVRYPWMILAQNEGFVIRNLIAYATGSVRFHIRVLWREATSY